MDELNLLTSNLDLSVLDNLSPEQRELALSILQEYAQTGDSKAYSELVMEDYAEAPVDILTFVDDYNYLGNAWHDAEGNSNLYPYWRKELLKIFPDNLTTTVNNGIFSGSRGRGKEQPLSSLVLTEQGYITMGDVEVGTKVYGRDGQLHPVTAIYPQGVKDIYKITFSDNTSARCGLQHLWQVEKDGKSSVVNIKQLLEYSKKESLKNYFIPLCQPINFDVDGDVNEAYQKGRDFVLSITDIVTEDLYSNVSIRIALLQGILDEAGDAVEKFIKISDTNAALKKVVSWLVHSLGGIVVTEDTSLKIFLPENITPFRLSRKLSLYNSTMHVQPYRYITSIEKLPYKEACQCIMVDSEEHLYITDNFIVTHNTEVATLIAAYLLHRILCLKDPIAYYHLKPTEKIVFAFMNIKLALAEEIGITKFQNTLQSSPWFMSHGELEGRTRKIWVPQKYNNQIAIDIKIGSQADDLIGLPIFFCLSGDTPIVTDKGTYNIETLENKIIRVPSIDDTGHIILSDECTVKQTAESDLEYSIELENGDIIKCTPTHRFKLIDGSYKEARHLIRGDVLLNITNLTLSLSSGIKVKQIQKNYLKAPKKYYDVINANPYNNFLIKTKDSYICSHNCFFDEISFIKNQDVEKQKKKAYDMLNTAVGGMKTRFVHKGKNPTFLVLASSKRSDKSFLEEHMRKKLKSEKANVYISDGPVWEVKPKGTYSDETFRVAVGNKFLPSLVIPDDDESQPYIDKGYKIIYPPVDFRAEFLDDIDRALCDYAGISSSSISKYINAARVKSLITTRIKNPFVREVIEVGDGEDDDVQYYNFFDLSRVDPALRSKPLFIHMDMSYTGDKTGISGVYIAGKKASIDEASQASDLFYSAAFSVSVQAPKGRHISFAKNRNFIYWLKEQGFNIKGITTDTYQSYDTGEQLRMKGYPYHVLSVDRVDTSKICLPYQYFKSTIYEKRLELFEDDLLFREITELDRNMETGKVDHPEGGSKDACDALCGAIYNASSHAEEYAYDYGESSEQLLRLNASYDMDATYSFKEGFEEELKMMGRSRMGLLAPPDLGSIAKTEPEYFDIPIL